jgi:hypothetical protein
MTNFEYLPFQQLYEVADPWMINWMNKLFYVAISVKKQT